jgi:hypothetical protein
MTASWSIVPVPNGDYIIEAFVSGTVMDTITITVKN